MEYPVPDPLRVEQIFSNSIPVAYTVWKDDGIIYADAQISGLSSYKGTDAGTVIQNAIDGLPTRGGTILISEGDYSITSPITVSQQDNLHLCGMGKRATCLTADASISHLLDIDRCNFLIIESMMLDGNNNASKSIELYGQSGDKMNQPLLRDTYITRSTGSDLHVSGYCEDGRLDNVEIKGTYSSWTLLADGPSSMNWTVCNSIFRTSKILLKNNPQGWRFVNNLFMDGDAGIRLQNPGVNDTFIAHNTFDQLTGDEIYVLAGPIGTRIINNYFGEGSIAIRVEGNSNRTFISLNEIHSFDTYGILIEATSGPDIPDWTVISENNIHDNLGNDIRNEGGDYVRVLSNRLKTSGQGANFYEADAGGINTPKYTVLWNNYVEAGINSTATEQVLEQNRGYTTENRGVATIASGTTSVTVSHGLAETPDPEDIDVNPVQSLGSATFYYVDEASITSTGFDIVVDTDPTQNVDFAWRADC